jgi:hypothetical protein
MLSERTRAALAARKRQGARLGNRTNLAEAQALGAARTAEAARRCASRHLGAWVALPHRFG